MGGGRGLRRPALAGRGWGNSRCQRLYLEKFVTHCCIDFIALLVRLCGRLLHGRGFACLPSFPSCHGGKATLEGSPASWAKIELRASPVTLPQKPSSQKQPGKPWVQARMARVLLLVAVLWVATPALGLAAGEALLPAQNQGCMRSLLVARAPECVANQPPPSCPLPNNLAMPPVLQAPTAGSCC